MCVCVSVCVARAMVDASLITLSQTHKSLPLHTHTHNSPQFLEFAPPGTTVDQITELSKKNKDKDTLMAALSGLWDGTYDACVCMYV